MGSKKKSWQEKLMDKKDLPKIVVLDHKLAFKWGFNPGDTMVIPSPLEVDEIMRKVSKGKLITINRIREALARRHGTVTACPITTGIFAKIAAWASEERKLSGADDITPYWRTLKKNGVINEKFPGGIEKQRELLEKEGYKVIKKGKNYIILDYEKFLATLEELI